MCDACQAEYDDPTDRRFHAQPNACPACGPRIVFTDASGTPTGTGEEALTLAIAALRDGKIVAVKGIGGFHLMADAANPGAVARLRTRKHREEKPFALMFPSLDAVRAACAVSGPEELLLTSPEAPIVLLSRLSGDGSSTLADAVAPHNPYLGVMLPYAPLHHLLLHDFGLPIVATSGNLSDEPLCTANDEALRRLAGIAECYLLHDRRIVRHIDDSIVRVVEGQPMVLRRARGYAPLPLVLALEAPETLAAGAHLKSTVAISRGHDILISQHLGDLETSEAYDAFRSEIDQMQSLFDVHPAAVVSDYHPDYLSSAYARARPEPQVRIQHHVAHVAACMIENAIAPPFLGVAWDGTGLGTDGTIWGGEFFSVGNGAFDRVAHLRQFPLPGGDAAAREPRRSAIGVLYTLAGEKALTWDDMIPVRSFTVAERSTVLRMLTRNINAPLTSSMGRMFDAVSAILGIRQLNAFEGQAAMELEWIGDDAGTDCYPLALNRTTQPVTLDWAPMIDAIRSDLHSNVRRTVISGRFHRGLADAILRIAQHVNLERVALSGGCFQNVLLTRCVLRTLGAAGFRVYRHQRIPPNDGCIAPGQIAAAAYMGLL